MISTIEISTIDPAPDREPMEVACHLYDSAVACYAEGQMRQAESLFRRALYLFEKHEGPAHPDVAQVLINLAVIYEDRCEYGAAERMYQRSVRVMEQTADDGDTNIEQMRLGAWCSLGAISRIRGEYDQAALLFHRALAHAERRFGPESMEVIEALNQLGMLGKDTGRFDEAEGYYHLALAILQQWLGPDHPGLAPLYHNLGELEHARGNHARSATLARPSVELPEQALGPDHPEVALEVAPEVAPEVAVDVAALAALLDGQGKYEEAEALYHRARKSSGARTAKNTTRSRSIRTTWRRSPLRRATKTVWSSIVHGAIMAAQSIINTHNIGHL